MKINGFIEIDKPREVVVKYFADPAYLGEYQDGFERKDLKSGEQGQTGAVSMLYYKYGKREMELEETITNNQLPELFEASYYHKHMDNTMACRFIEVEPGKTRYEYEFEYTRINWVLPKLMAILFPSMYSKPAQKWLRQFKEFVEGQ